MIASILTAIGMAIDVLVEALLPSGTAGTTGPLPKDKKGAKEWVRNKPKASPSLLGRLGMKVAEAVISWILNRVKEVVDWVSQTLWTLVLGVGWLLHTYMVMKK